MKKFILIITQLLLGFLPLLAKTQKQPNLILIMADDMGYECVRSNGGTSYTTPHWMNLPAPVHASSIATPSPYARPRGLRS